MVDGASWHTACGLTSSHVTSTRAAHYAGARRHHLQVEGESGAAGRAGEREHAVGVQEPTVATTLRRATAANAPRGRLSHPHLYWRVERMSGAPHPDNASTPGPWRGGTAKRLASVSSTPSDLRGVRAIARGSVRFGRSTDQGRCGWGCRCASCHLYHVAGCWGGGTQDWTTTRDGRAGITAPAGRAPGCWAGVHPATPRYGVVR